MYCPNKPQRFLRCEHCWCAARVPNEHHRFCPNRSSISTELDCFDQIHNPGQPRLWIKTSNPAGMRKRSWQNDVETIIVNVDYVALYGGVHLRWPDKESILFRGSKTMYFRVLLTTAKSILCRIDVLGGSCNYTIIDQPISQLNAQPFRNQVAAILALQPKEQQLELRLNGSTSCTTISIGQMMEGCTITAIDQPPVEEKKDEEEEEEKGENEEKKDEEKEEMPIDLVPAEIEEKKDEDKENEEKQDEQEEENGEENREKE